MLDNSESDFLVFDIKRFKKLNERTNELSQLSKDQDVLLLLGGSGSGKSTTLHFLAGSTLHHDLIDGISHLTPSKIKHESLNDVRTSPHARSETHQLKLIPINFSDVGLPRDGGIVVCDTPGLFTNHGSEADIANSLALLEVMKVAKSVRPVVHINYNSVGDRGEGFKEIAHSLLKIFKNISDYLSSFKYVFTKYPNEELSQINALVNSVKKNLSPTELSDKYFVAVLESIIDATMESVIALDPQEDEPKKIIRILTKANPIMHPHEVFHFYAPDKSILALKSQIIRHQQMIQDSVKENYLLAQNKLEQLKILKNSLALDFVKDAYESSSKLFIQNSDLTKISSLSAEVLHSEFASSAESINQPLIRTSEKIDENNEQTKPTNTISNKVIKSANTINIIGMVKIDTPREELFKLSDEDNNEEQSRIMSYSLGVRDYKNLIEVNNATHRLKSPKLTCWFEKKVIDNFNLIKELFNSDSQMLYEMEIVITSYDKMLDTIDKLSQEKGISYLISQGYDQIDSLLMKIEQFTNGLKELSLEMMKIEAQKESNVTFVNKLYSIKSIYESMLITPGIIYPIRYCFYLFGSQLGFTEDIWKNANDYLRINGYENIGELKLSIDKRLLQIAELDAFLKSKRNCSETTAKDLEKCQEIFNVYHKTIEGRKWLLKRQTEQFLQKQGFTSINELKDNIKMIKDKVTSLLIRAELNYNFFCVFDTPLLEDVYIFLSTCKSLRICSQDLTITTSMFNDFMSKYSALTQRKLVDFSKNVSLYSEFEIQISTPWILESLRVLKEMLNGPKKISIFFPNKITENFLDDLQNQHFHLSDQMMDFERGWNLDLLFSKLQVIKLLTVFDSFFTDRLFSKLYHDNHNKFYSLIVETTNLAEASIKNGNFFEAARNLEILRKLEVFDNDFVKQLFIKLKKHLSSKLVEDISRLTQDVIFIDRRNYKIELIRVINKIKNLSYAKESCVNYLDTNLLTLDHLNKSIESNVNLLRDIFIKNISSSEIFIDSSDFFEAEENLNIVKQLTFILESYISPQDSERALQLSVRLKEKFESSIVFYLSMDINDYIDSPPSFIFEKLDKFHSSDLKQYKIALSKLKDNVISRFNNELEKLKALSEEGARNKFLKKCQLILKTLPNYIREFLSVKLQDCNHQISENKGNSL